METALAIIVVLSAILIFGNAYDEDFINGTKLMIDVEDINNQKSDVLSRRKRFIVFPDGSSFQLVFCTQTHGYLQIGDIVWFGNTAALAWELPSDPSIFNILRENKRVFDGNRRSDNKHIYYLDEDGKVIGKQAYRKKPIVNPAFAKRSVDINKTKSLPIKKMHELQKNANYLSSLPERSIEFHRSGRKSLYVKVEKVLQALGWKGKECVLRMLCETSKPKKDQGTFLDEILRITFTLPKGRDFEADHHKLYDVAHGSHGHCATLYPDCEDLHGLPLYDIE